MNIVTCSTHVSLFTEQELLLVLGEDQVDKQDDGEEGDDHQHHVSCRVSSGGCGS